MTFAISTANLKPHLADCNITVWNVAKMATSDHSECMSVFSDYNNRSVLHIC